MDNADPGPPRAAAATPAAAPRPASHEAGRDGAADDDALVAAYLDGDVHAFETLYRRHKDPLYRFFVRQLPAATAQDAFQDTWLKLVDALPTYKAQERFAAYLFAIAHNVLNDHHRRQMRSPEPSEPEVEHPATTPGSEMDHEQAELRARLHELVRALPLNQRTVWLLRQETDLSLQQIARLTRSSVEGAKSRLRYARETLKAGMQRYVRQ